MLQKLDCAKDANAIKVLSILRESMANLLFKQQKICLSKMHFNSILFNVKINENKMLAREKIEYINNTNCINEK